MDTSLHKLFDPLIVGLRRTHRVKSILVLLGSFGETTSMKRLSVRNKRERRSFQLPTSRTIQNYYSGRRGGPEKRRLLDCPQRDFSMADQ